MHCFAGYNRFVYMQDINDLFKWKQNQAKTEK